MAIERVIVTSTIIIISSFFHNTHTFTGTEIVLFLNHSTLSKIQLYPTTTPTTTHCHCHCTVPPRMGLLGVYSDCWSSSIQLEQNSSSPFCRHGTTTAIIIMMWRQREAFIYFYLDRLLCEYMYLYIERKDGYTVVSEWHIKLYYYKYERAWWRLRFWAIHRSAHRPQPGQTSTPAGGWVDGGWERRVIEDQHA